MPAIAKIAIATIALGLFGFVTDMMMPDAHWLIWAIGGAIYGLVCHPWFKALRQTGH